MSSTPAFIELFPPSWLALNGAAVVVAAMASLLSTFRSRGYLTRRSYIHAAFGFIGVGGWLATGRILEIIRERGLISRGTDIAIIIVSLFIFMAAGALLLRAYPDDDGKPPKPRGARRHRMARLSRHLFSRMLPAENPACVFKLTPADPSNVTGACSRFRLNLPNSQPDQCQSFHPGTGASSHGAAMP